MLKPGDLVGPYEIRGFLGQGGMGQVYKAFDPRLERTVALKVIVVPERSSNDSERLVGEFSARLLREARAVASLSHPNVVGVYDVGESGDRLYLAMEYVVGATLRSLATSTEIPMARKLRWLTDIARALEVAHRAGLVHRDVKPENVMIREDGAVKVLDFGIARRTMAGTEDQQKLDTVTGSGTITGTPVYMAPEQIKGRDVDARCDQFAWGVMAYELLAGERPWPDNGDVLQLVAKVLTDPPPPLRERGAHAAEIPGAVEETILRALAKEPDARFPSMADVAEAVEPFAMQTTGGDRVRITPRISDADDPSAFAATTRVPTSVSVPPAAEATAAAPAERTTERKNANKRKRTRRKLTQLALPLALLGALAAVVVLVRKNANVPPAADAARPLSVVPEAETAYKEAMQLWHDGATGKARATLRHAVELDPSFAAAHLQLAIQTVQDDPSGAQASFQNAFEHRHMLLPRDTAMLDACVPYVRPHPDLDEWETRLTGAVFLFPRDAELQFFLGRARERQGADEAAKAAYEAAVRLDSGFVPALAALASAERNLGHVQEALAATERCIKQSPVAATCVETRYRLLGDLGECHRAREEAAQWRTLEPQSPPAFTAFARALFADGAPRPSVEEALSRAWTLQPPAKRASSEQWDRMYLAIVDGDLERADQLAREFEAALPPSADQFDHAMPSRVRINVLYENGDLEGAVKVAHGFLDRMDAWPAYAFAPDSSIAFYEPLYRSGEIKKAELDRQRARWVEREKQRLAGGDRSTRAAWGMWAIWGGFAETKEEALEAIGRMPQSPLPVGSRRVVSLDFAVGKVYALVGRPREALPSLVRVTTTCSSLEDAMLITRARYYLGMAHEANGEKNEAREAYQKVVAAWPKDTRSRTVRWAAARLEALAK
ncbi:MAG: serine/threonine protein kinase [Labilithrix sp.]|nr:serine/threonine protein kinase [Labilithrix sp.]